jgi:hypothetical protein
MQEEPVLNYNWRCRMSFKQVINAAPEWTTEWKALGLNSPVSVAAVYYPLNDQLEVFSIDQQGALTVVWKVKNGAWQSRLRLTPENFAAPGAPLAAVFYPINNQLEVFLWDKKGSLHVVWKAQNGAWAGPGPLTPENFAAPDTPVSAVYYPLNNQLEVFLVDKSGAFNVIWKAQNGAWNGPLPLFQNAAPVSTPLSAVYYPLNNQLEVFLVDGQGALKVIWKAQNGAWHEPFPITGPAIAPVRAPLSAVYYPVNDQLEVFTIDTQGAMVVVWKAQNGNWQSVTSLTPNESAAGMTPPIAIYYPTNNQLEVLFADSFRSLNVLWKVNNGAWNNPVGITLSRYLGAAVTWAAVSYPIQSQLEVFTTDPNQGLFVEWKVNNGSWAPCPVRLAGQPPVAPAAATVMETTRIAQLTGARDPEGLPILNNDSPSWGVEGVDLGANTEHDGKLFFFFGDVPKIDRSDGPSDDADLVAYTTDPQVGPDGFRLNPVMQGGFFHPFTVDPPFGVLGRDRTPTGAFSFEGRVYVFALAQNPDDLGNTNDIVSILTSNAQPDQPGEYRLEFQFDNPGFWQVAPVVVHNSWMEVLPSRSGSGVILYGSGGATRAGAPSGIHLAWMPLPIAPHGQSAPSGIRYYTGSGSDPWSPRAEDATVLISHPQYTAVSANWFADAGLWILLYSNAADPVKSDNPFAATGPIVARIGSTPWQLSDEIEIFNPCRERAYGRYMHWPGLDSIASDIPPNLGEHVGWAYGAFLTNRFCRWDEVSRVLTLQYLLSLSCPYQVQLMRSRLLIPAG